jgi:pSer/pThr/pTyr-binding forkhead associated (FHA) protein
LTSGRQWTVGRDRSADVVLPSRVVDRKHAVLDFRGEQCLVSDARSTSGTFLNGKVVREPTPLRKGDELRIGGYTVVVEDDRTS